jgi:hypothetical protein
MEKIILTNGKKSYTLAKEDVFRSIYLEGLINYELNANNNIIEELILKDVKNNELKQLVKILKLKKRTIKKKYAEFLSDYHIKYLENISNHLTQTYDKCLNYILCNYKKMVIIEPVQSNLTLNIESKITLNNESNCAEYICTIYRSDDLVKQISLYFDTCESKYNCIQSLSIRCYSFYMTLFDENSFKLMQKYKLIKIDKILSYFENEKLIHRYKMIIPFWFSKDGPNAIDVSKLKVLIYNLKSHRNNIKELKEFKKYINEHFNNYLCASNVSIEDIKLNVKISNAKNISFEKQHYALESDIMNGISNIPIYVITPRYKYEKLDVSNQCVNFKVDIVCSKIYINYEFKDIEIRLSNIENPYMIVSYSKTINDSNTLTPLLNLPFSDKEQMNRNRMYEYNIKINLTEKIEYVELLLIIEEYLIFKDGMINYRYN